MSQLKILQSVSDGLWCTSYCVCLTISSISSCQADKWMAAIVKKFIVYRSFGTRRWQICAVRLFWIQRPQRYHFFMFYICLAVRFNDGSIAIFHSEFELIDGFLPKRSRRLNNERQRRRINVCNCNNGVSFIILERGSFELKNNECHISGSPKLFWPIYEDHVISDIKIVKMKTFHATTFLKLSKSYKSETRIIQ